MADATPTLTPPTPKSGPGSGLTPSKYLGCGCASFVTVVMLVVVVLALVAYRQGKGFEESLADPELRDERSRALLGYEELPDGYHPMGGFSMPFIMRMAMVSDRDLAPGETVENESQAFRERGFVFMNMRSWGDQADELRAYFTDPGSTTDFFADTNLNFVTEETVGRGSLDSGAAQVLTVTERGTMALVDGRRPVQLVRLLIDCPGDDRLRVGLWFTPPPDETEAAEAALGEPQIRQFLDHFDLCL
jgi:hypothetical protein